MTRATGKTTVIFIAIYRYLSYIQNVSPYAASSV
jgi:hypothetical protein